MVNTMRFARISQLAHILRQRRDRRRDNTQQYADNTRTNQQRHQQDHPAPDQRQAQW
jgi:hypothetical protein